MQNPITNSLAMPTKPQKTYSQIAFALEVLKFLAEKPLKRAELAQLMADFLEKRGKDCDDVTQKLTRTIAQLRDCGLEIESAPHHPYTLKVSNFPVILSPAQRQALYLAAHFLAEMGFSAQAGQIYRLGNLREADSPSDIQVDFHPPLDYSEVAVEEKVKQLQQRIEKRCFYSIRYLNSQGKENQYDLGLSEFRLHNGVLYLFAHLHNFNSHRFTNQPNIDQNFLFRIDRIVYIYPSSNTPWFWQEFSSLAIRYRMLGPLATYQPRRHKETVLERHGDYVDIETQEDYLFWFRQRILQYGVNIQVLEPEWLVKEIAEELLRMYNNYKILVSI
jgi:predicted DNA-binding transcriptional regulator YafY